MLDEFYVDLKSTYFDIKAGNKESLKDFKKKWNITSTSGEVYQSLSKKNIKKSLGSFYTPYEIIGFMVKEVLEKIDYKKNPNIKVIDPSCGGGYFLICLIDELIKKAEEINIKNPALHVINNNIYGFDIDNNAIMLAAIDIYDKTGIVPPNIICKDFLTEDIDKYDIVIGNPPYMGHKIISKDYREALSQGYKDVFADKGDLSYCFIKRSIDSLKDGGRLLFFTSRYLLEALNGRNIRKFLLDNGNVEKIIDFYGIRFVKGAGVDNIIIQYEQKDGATFYSGYEVERCIKYYRMKPEAKGKGSKVFEDMNSGSFEYFNKVICNKDDLNESGWIFLRREERNILNKIKGTELGAICDSFQGIITGCDRAFVLKGRDAEDLGIESTLLKPWIKSSNIERYNVKGTDEIIIYSDLIKDEKQCPEAISYIGKWRERLEERRECKKGTRKWYGLQWGRDEEIFTGRKIIYPYKASTNRFAIDEGSFFSADVYAISIKGLYQGIYSYEYLEGLLNSRIYEFYIKSMAKKLGDDLYDYYPNKIMTLRIPGSIDGIEEEIIKGEEGIREKIDKVIMEHLGITDFEYSIIKEWCL